MNVYHPTLWRTCRVLSNIKRLKCLAAVLSCPGLTVGDAAERVNLPENHASECLRALQARGLIQARRQSRWVRYFPEPDPIVPSAAPLLSALKAALRTSPRTEKEFVRLLAGFTHPRRLQILACLKNEGPFLFETLARKTSISPQALYRHLANLRLRNLVQNENGVCFLVPQNDVLTNLLIRLASE